MTAPSLTDLKKNLAHYDAEVARVENRIREAKARHEEVRAKHNAEIWGLSDELSRLSADRSRAIGELIDAKLAQDKG